MGRRPSAFSGPGSQSSAGTRDHFSGTTRGKRQLSPDERPFQYQTGSTPKVHGFSPAPSLEAGGLAARAGFAVRGSQFAVRSSQLDVGPEKSW